MWGQVEVYVEPILPKPVMLVVGSGHVGKAVAHLASWLGFYVVVSDDRPEFCTPQAVPEAHEYLPVPMAKFRTPRDYSLDLYRPDHPRSERGCAGPAWAAGHHRQPIWA